MDMLLNPREPVRFEPADQAGRPEGERIAYLLKVPSKWDAIAFKKAIVARGGRNPGWLGALRALRAALAELHGATGIDGEAAAAQLATVEAVIAEHEAFIGEVNAGAYPAGDEDAASRLVARVGELAALRDDLGALSDIARDYVPRYAAVLADAEVYREIVGLVAAQKFVVGWEGMDEPPRRDAAGLAEDSLRLIPDGHLIAIGLKVEALMALPETSAKNSDSPSPSSSTRTSSPTASNTVSRIH